MPVSEIYVPNLRLRPEKLDEVKPEVTYTLPDLHGNAMYLLYICGLLGIVEFDASTWQKLWSLYERDMLTKRDFNTFSNLVGGAFSYHFYPSLRLIGDVLADRGRHDYLTLIVLEHVFDALTLFDKQFTIIYSNHDAVFLNSARLRSQHAYFQLDEALYPEVIEAGGSVTQFFNSMVRLRGSIEQGVVTVSDVMRIVEKVVKPSLSLIACEWIDSRPVIFSHAPTHIDFILYLSTVLGVSQWYSGAADIDHFTEKLNAAFSQNLQRMFDGAYSDLLLDFIEERGDKITQHVDQVGEGEFYYVHGHTSEDDEATSHHYPIDGLLGQPGYDAGFLNLFASHEICCPSEAEALMSDDLNAGREALAAQAVHAGEVSMFASRSRLALWSEPQEFVKYDGVMAPSGHSDSVIGFRHSDSSPFRLVKSS